MVTMATMNKIQRLRKFFESNNSSSFELPKDGANRATPDRRKGKKKAKVNNSVLLERSTGQNTETPLDSAKPPCSLATLSTSVEKFWLSKNEVTQARLVRKGGVRRREEPPTALGDLSTYEPGSSVDLSGPSGSNNPSLLKLPRSKSTGQLNVLAEEEGLAANTPSPNDKRSLSQNPLCAEVEYAVPCSALNNNEKRPGSPPHEYENTRRFTSKHIGRRDTGSPTDNSPEHGAPQGSVQPGPAGVTYRYKSAIERKLKQDSLDRRSSRSLPDLTFQEDSIKIVGAKGLFQNLTFTQRSPQKPVVPSKSPSLTARPVGNGDIASSPSPNTSPGHYMPVNHTSPFFIGSIRTQGSVTSNVENLRSRFEGNSQPPPAENTSELPCYERPNISSIPVSGGEDSASNNYYHIPDTPTSTISDEPNQYENPDNPATIVEDPLSVSGNQEKLKKIFGVQDLKGDILDKRNQTPKKAGKSSKKKRSTIERNVINFYAVSPLQTDNTNSHMRGKKMDGGGSSTLPSSGVRPVKENSSSSGDSGNSHTYSLQSLSPRTSGRKPSTDDPSLRDSDFIDGEIDFEERGPQGSDSDFESEEENSKVKAPKPNTFNNNSHKVAYELLTSERTYVDKLHLLSAIFQTKISADNEKHKWFSVEVIKDIFSNISSIYNFHFGHFLPELEMRLLQWDRKPCIGDILKTLSPFLRMYAEYVSNFDKAMSQLTLFRAKVPKFASALSNITQTEKRCQGLALEHHMLEPVQRIPRYELLLKEYLKKLPDESQDRDDALKALEVISQAADHSNNRMKVMEEIGNLFKLNARIDGMDIIDPSRRLLKEGKLDKVTPKNDLQERYIFFFNDLLLCCVTKKTKLTGSKVYKLKEKLEVDGMQVLDSDGERFQVEGAGTLLEFMASSEEDKEEWLKVLWGAVRELIRKKDTFKNSVADVFEISYEDALGKEPPKYIRDEEVTMCMRCGTDFERLLKRRHHCRACGYVVCGRCSCNQIELPYDKNKLNRVCGRCFQKLGKQPVMDDLTRRSFVPDLEVTEHYASSLELHQKGMWIRYWVAVTEQDLFALRAPRDVRAVLTLPVKLYEVRDVPESERRMDRDHVFKFIHGQSVYLFAAESQSIKLKWLKVLSEGVEADVNDRSENTAL